MINGNGVHLPDTTYGGNPINWNCSSDSDDSLQRLKAENAKLRELVARLIRHIEDPPCESCMSEMSCAGGEGLTNCDEYQFMVCDAHELGVDA